MSSKKLSYILRHGIIEQGLSITNDGYVDIEHLLNLDILNGWNFNTINDIVKNDNKNRYSLIKKDDKYFIRANQGHSTQVGSLINDNLLLDEITIPIEDCFHGTFVTFLDSIKKEGLKVMNRKHIHIARNLNAKSGKRNSCNVLVYIDMKKAMKDGIKFYKSLNDVILTTGINGILAPQYFSKIQIL